MQRITAMTLGALAIGFAGFAYDAASAQTPASTPAACPKYESTVYFSPNSAELNAYSDDTIVRIAKAAQACGAKGIVVQAAADGDRAQTVATALRAKGIKAVIVPSQELALSGEAMINRSVILRVALPGTRFG